MSETPEPKQPSSGTVDNLVAAIDRAYNRPWLMMWRSFLHGFMTALGATVGTALFFTILLWIFQRLGGIDLLAPQIQKLQNLIIPDQFKADTSDQEATLQNILKENNLTLPQ